MGIVYRFLTVVIAILLLTGCGYTTGSLLPDHLKTIYVDNFKNSIDVSAEPSAEHGYRISRPGVENEVTQALTNQFLFDGNLRIVNKDDADLVITGEVIDYYKQPLRYDKFDNIEEYRVIITVNMKLEDTVRGDTMWKKDGFIGYDTYFLTGAHATDEAEARQGAVDDLAERIVEKVVEAW